MNENENRLSDELRAEVEAQLDAGSASKRARQVAELIMRHGSCTTSDIEALGYKHSPRAVRDLRDAGVALKTNQERYTDPATGSIKQRARYTIVGTTAGSRSRRAVSKRFADAVKSKGRCAVCGSLPPLQVDHRVPFSVGGESFPHVASEFMPVCLSCNRTKSWACEHCPNWSIKNVDTCKTCMWASPENYTHVATEAVREIRVKLVDPIDIERFDAHKPDVQQLLVDYMKDADGK